MRAGFEGELHSPVHAVHSIPRNAFAEGFALAIPLVILGTLLSAPAASARVHASIVVDAATGHVLEAHHADRLAYPASLTKLMTLYLVFRALDRGALSLHQKLRVSRHAAAQSPVKLWLRPGSHITVKSAILAITTRSANDAAVVLGEALGHTEWRFARLMTRTARRLGMRHTTFRNASGLPNRHQ
ncbi:MAG TPA: serine hydrolase, partial [Terriglobia bacterium]|nr:serine hydrolase [Terriglobia bacterium]